MADFWAPIESRRSVPFSRLRAFSVCVVLFGRKQDADADHKCLHLCIDVEIQNIDLVVIVGTKKAILSFAAEVDIVVLGANSQMSVE